MKKLLIILFTIVLSGCTLTPTSEDKIISQQPIHQDIKVDDLQSNQVIQSPLTITGQAKGNWFFEGVFEVKLLDNQGQEVATAIANTPGEWMTQDFIPFSVSLEFTSTGNEQGTLVFIKNNPSDNPSLNDKLILPVIY